MTVRAVLVVLAVVSFVACGDRNDAGRSDAGMTTVPDTGPSDDLAPSQLTAETAPAPETPPPCDPSVISVWTAQVLIAEPWVDAVLRVRNDGDVRCEVDVSGSPYIDPLIEFDAWLDAGAWADLVVGPDGNDCAGPAVVRDAEIDLNGASVRVATAAVVPCGWRLTAFYPDELSDDPCGALDVAVVDGAVVLRNAAFRPCRLGSLTTVDGRPVEGVPSDGSDGPEVPVLAGGDVVAVATGDVESPLRTVALGFDSGVVVEAELDAVVTGGPPRPWIGGPGSPATDDPAELLAALDPFARIEP